MRINKTATYLRPGYYQEFDEGSDLGGQAQDVETRLENILFQGDDDVDDLDDAVIDGEGDDSLPDDDDADEEDEAELEDEDSEEDSDDETLASALGLDEDKLDYDEDGNVIFNATIDGEVHPVKIDDLVKSYQLHGHVNNKSIALENDRKAFKETADKAYGELTTRLEGVNKLAEHLEQQILGEFNGVDWDALRVSDPAEWAALRQVLSDKAGQINQIKQLAGQEQERIKADQEKELTGKRQEFVQAEFQKMVADNPTWSNQETMAKDFADIGSFLQSEYGFSAEEVANSLDSRLMRMIQDARSYRSAKKTVTEKKVEKKVPKYRKPGSNSSNRASLAKARKAKASKKAIRESGGSIDSVASSIIDRM